MRIIRKPDKNISKEMIGLFFEDINYAADGGLYAEMIENRSFEAKEAVGVVHSFYTVDDPGYAWSPVCGARKNAPRMQYVSGSPLSEQNPHYLRFTARQAGQSPHQSSGRTATRSPGRKAVTPEPVFSTTPDISWPMVCGIPTR